MKDERLKDERFIGFELRRLSNVIKRKLDSIAVEMGLDDATTTHGWVIRFLMHNQDKDMFQKNFEEKFSIRRSTATNILKLMEKNGLITRESVPYDARLKKIILTERAIELHDRMGKEIHEIEKSLSKGISEEDLETVYRVFDQMRANISSEQANDYICRKHNDTERGDKKL